MAPIFMSMMIQIVDRPNMTPTGQEETLELPSFALIVQARSWFRFSSWISLVAGISKLKKILFTSVVASATRTYLRVKNILPQTSGGVYLTAMG